MPTMTWLEYLPLWAPLPTTVMLVLMAIEGGYRLAVFRKRPLEKNGDAPIGSVIGGTLGLLAFLLAFTFEKAASRFGHGYPQPKPGFGCATSKGYPESAERVSCQSLWEVTDSAPPIPQTQKVSE